MSVPTVRAENDVFGLEMSAGSDRDGLLADVGVTRPMNQSTLMRPGQLLFAAANQQHLLVKQQELGFVQSGEAMHGLLVYREDLPQARFAQLELGKYSDTVAEPGQFRLEPRTFRGRYHSFLPPCFLRPFSLFGDVLKVFELRAKKPRIEHGGNMIQLHVSNPQLDLKD
jgi:hypothetical protein